VAGYHAGVLIRQIVLGLPAKATTRHIPWVTYTEPELAQVGLTEAEAAALRAESDRRLSRIGELVAETVNLRFALCSEKQELYYVKSRLAAANALLRRALPYLFEWFLDEAIDDEQEEQWRAQNVAVVKLRDDIRKHLEEVE
jgi:hypothetical protein